MFLPQYQRLNLEIFKGVDYKATFYLEDYEDNPINITNTTISAIIRTELDLSAPIIATFSIVKTSPTIGEFDLILTEEVSASISDTYGFYTLKYDDGNFTDVYLYGQIDFIGTT